MVLSRRGGNENERGVFSVILTTRKKGGSDVKYEKEMKKRSSVSKS